MSIASIIMLSHDVTSDITWQSRDVTLPRFENLPNLFECSIKRDLLDSEWEPPQQQYYWNNIAPDLQTQKKMSLTHIVAALDLVGAHVV